MIAQISIASGGDTIDVVKLYEEDIERIARIRSELELERERSTIKITTLESEMFDLQEQISAQQLQIETLEGSCTEKAETIILLYRQVCTFCPLYASLLV